MSKMSKIKCIDFDRDLNPAEQSLVAESKQGVFAFRIAQEPLKLIVAILHDIGYKTNMPMTPSNGCAAAFNIFSENARFAAVLFAIEMKGKAHYEIRVWLAQMTLVDRVRKLLGLPHPQSNEIEGNSGVDTILEKLSDRLAQEYGISNVVHSETDPYMPQKK